MLELYNKISYFIATNRFNSTAFVDVLVEKICNRNYNFKVICRGGGQFFIKNLYYIIKPNQIGVN